MSVAQVEIKEEVILTQGYEIILDETIIDERDAIILSMPFYGRVYSQIPCQPSHWTSGAIKIERRAGEQIYKDGCRPPFECGSGSCGCIGTRAHSFLEIAQGEEIFIQIDRCYAPPPIPPGVYEWYEVPLQFSDVGNNRYDLYGEDIADGSIDYVGYIKFFPTPPPGCKFAEECDLGFEEEMPDTITIKKPFSFTRHLMCQTRVNPQGVLKIPLGQFSPVLDGSKTSNIFNWSPVDDINVCFDLQTHEFKFNFNVEKIELYYMKELCIDNIQNPPVNATIVPDIDALNNIPASECSKLLASLKAHESYPFTDGLYDGYFFEEITMVHETEHQRDWELIVGDHIPEYFNIPQKINYSCEDFNSISEAKGQILKDVRNLYGNDYWNPHRIDWFIKLYNYPDDEPTKELKRKYEIAVHNREAVREKIKEYKEAINDKCNSN